MALAMRPRAASNDDDSALENAEKAQGSPFGTQTSRAEEAHFPEGSLLLLALPLGDNTVWSKALRAADCIAHTPCDHRP